MLEHVIAKGVPFNGMREGVKEAILGDPSLLHEQLSKDVQKIFDNVLHDFDLMFIVEEVPDAKRDALREEMNDFVSKARTTLDGPVAVALGTAMTESDTYRKRKAYP